MDVWDLPPLELGNNPCPTPVEYQNHIHQSSWIWVTDPVANKHHDCTTCRDEIGPGDLYHREAIPLHNKVIVFKECKGCR